MLRLACRSDAASLSLASLWCPRHHISWKSPRAIDNSPNVPAAVADGLATKPRESRVSGFFSKMREVELQNDSILNTPAKQRRREKILKEREEMLRFRDIGLDVDRVILKRDTVQLLKLVYLGKEYAVDVELERMLRYFKEHQVVEVKNSYGMKIYCGFDRLSSSAGAVLVPPMAVSKASQFFAPPEPGTVFNPEKVLQGSGVKYGSAASVVTNVSPMFFKQPTILLIGPVGTTATHEIEVMWREIYVDMVLGTKAQTPAAPPLPASAPAAKQAPKRTLKPPPGIELAEKADANPQDSAATIISEEDVVRAAAAHTSDYQLLASQQKVPIPRLLPSDLPRKPSVDFISIREIETPYKFAFNQVVNRTCRRFPFQLLEKTYIGHSVMSAFFESALPLRNPRVTYVMLVDHHGRIRWTTSGPPNKEEAKLLPILLQQLVVEQLKESLS
jgi:hypothetical protein